MSEKGKWPKRVSQSEVYMKSKMCCIYLSLPCRRSNKVRQVPLAIHFELGYFGYWEGKVWKLPTEYWVFGQNGPFFKKIVTFNHFFKFMFKLTSFMPRRRHIIKKYFFSIGKHGFIFVLKPQLTNAASFFN